MKWRIPVVFEMTGIQEIEADQLEEAMAHACDSFDPVDSDFKDGSLALDCSDVETVRIMYNNNRPDGLEAMYPELAYYGLDDHERNLSWEDDGSEDAEAREHRICRGMGQYRFVFEVAGARYYCNVEALSLCEALGSFCREHPHITYDMIIDHMEA